MEGLTTEKRIRILGHSCPKPEQNKNEWGRAIYYPPAWQEEQAVNGNYCCAYTVENKGFKQQVKKLDVRGRQQFSV